MSESPGTRPSLLVRIRDPHDREAWRQWIPAIVIEVLSPGSQERDYADKRHENTPDRNVKEDHEQRQSHALHHPHEYAVRDQLCQIEAGGTDGGHEQGEEGDASAPGQIETVRSPKSRCDERV